MKLQEFLGTKGSEGREYKKLMQGSDTIVEGMDESTFDKSFNGILVNMVVIARRKAELDNMDDIVDKALKNNMINSKQHIRLKREIVSLRGSITK